MQRALKFNNKEEFLKKVELLRGNERGLSVRFAVNNLNMLEKIATEVIIQRGLSIYSNDVSIETSIEGGCSSVYISIPNEEYLLRIQDSIYKNKDSFINFHFVLIDYEYFYINIDTDDKSNVILSRIMEGIMCSYDEDIINTDIEMENSDFLEKYKNLLKNRDSGKTIQAGNHYLKFTDSIEPLVNIDDLVNIVYELVEEDNLYLDYLNKVFLGNKYIIKPYMAFNNKKLSNFKVVYSIDNIVNNFKLLDYCRKYRIDAVGEEIYEVGILKLKKINKSLIIIGREGFTETQLYLSGINTTIHTINENLNIMFSRGCYNVGFLSKDVNSILKEVDKLSSKDLMLLKIELNKRLN